MSSRLTQFCFMVFLGLIGALGVASSAGAFFAGHGGGVGSASVGTLVPPSNVVAVFPSPNVRTVDVSWTAPTEAAGMVIQGYYVQSYVGATASPACGTSSTALITSVSCEDTDVPSNTYTYTVTAVFRSWTATSAPSGPVTVPASILSSFTLDPSTPTPTAGSSFTVNITALDQYGNVDTNYTGAECLTFSGPSNSPNLAAPSYPDQASCASGSAVTFLNGVASGANAPTLTLYDVQAVSLVATDNPTGVDGATDLSILPGPVTSFGVANPGTQMVGVSFGDSITALDQYGNTVTAYTGTQTLEFSGPSDSPNLTAPIYPTSVTFDLGIGTVTDVTLFDAQTTTLTATQGPVTGTSTDFLVESGSATSYVILAPASATTGVPFPVAISTCDAYGNPATSYDGTADLVSSGGSITPVTVTLTNGSASFNATLSTAGDQTITGTDSNNSTITGVSGTIDVVSPSPSTYTVTYNQGAATSGTPPVDTHSPYDTGVSVTVLANPGSLAESGYTFTGWSTQPNGAGTIYTPGETFTISSNTTLYPVFTENTPPPTTYTVTYNQGAATSGTPPVDTHSPYDTGVSVTVLANPGSLAESGYTFTGWSTQPNGAGTIYTPGETFTISSNTTLYPVFTENTPPPTTYTVTYNQGAATSGTPPVDTHSPYDTGVSVTVLANPGSLAESGYTFTGWSTQPNGAGTIYTPGETFTISSNTTLYPVFTENTPPPTTYTVTYNQGAATSGTPPVDTHSPYDTGVSVTVLANPGSLAESGYTFTGWSTQPNGAGTIYTPGETFTISSNTTLYPVFTENTPPPTTYTVTYNQGAATSGTPPVDTHSPYDTGVSVTVLANPGSLAESGYTFTGWSTQPNGAGTIYTPGETFTISSNTTLYPVFTENTPPPTTYTVTYNQGAATSGTPPVDTHSPYDTGVSVTVLANPGSLAESGYTFTGWSTQPNGAGTIYTPGETFTISSNTTLYPVFTENTPPPTTYTVTYNQGAATSGTPPVDTHSPYDTGVSVTVLANPGSLAESGYTFTGWSTQPNGAGTIYTPGETFTISSNTTLYPVFTENTPPPTTYTVTYNQGAATSGTPPVDTHSPYDTGVSVTVLANPGSLAESGYTFTGWSTQPNGAGTIYTPGETFTISSNTTLYPVFTENTPPPTTYTVTYNQGAATSGTPPVDTHSPYDTGVSVTVLANPGSLAESGYTFTGWSTQPNGAGTIYTPGETFTISSNTTLYPVFTENTPPPTTYTVTYNQGAATSGTPPVDTHSPYDTGVSVTVLANPGSLAESGYTFTGWSTQPNGAGTIYTPGETFTISSNTTLYPVFTENTPPPTTYTVTYNQGAATSGTPPVDTHSPYDTGVSVTVLANPGSLAESGYTFTGWSTQPNGAGTIYTPGETFTISSNTTLYPVFTENTPPPTTYTVTYNQGAATSGTPPVDTHSPYDTGVSVTVLANPGSLAESGYTFTGWSTQPNGAGTIYTPGETFTISSNTTLYPVFTENTPPPTTYTVTYNQGAATSGTPPVDTHSPYDTGVSVTVLANPGSLAESGYTFTGWSTQPNGAGTIYTPGETFTISSNTTLYPVFTENTPPPTTYTVTYNQGAATSGTPPVDTHSPYDTGVSVTVLANPGSLAESGYTFTGWSTQPNGAGTIYTPGETFTISSNTTLYPVFTENTPPPTTYTVTYNQGAATSGTPPVDTHSPYDTGVSVTVLANPGSLAESGYTFTGWSTQPNGAGTIYTPGETFTISSNTTLYPVFTENTPPPTTYTVTYNQGAATSGTPPVDTHSPYDTGVSVTVLANPGSLAESGYTFTGWSTQPNGAGTIYTPGETFTISSNTTLYPVFTENTPPPTTYTVTYNQGAATSGTPPVDTHSPYDTGVSVTVLANPGSLAESGYTFTGWSTQPNGAGTIYTPGETFTISSNTTLYPVFTENTPPPTTYTVTYNQGAATSGTPPVDTHSPYDTGVSVTVLANPGSLAESGYTFTGWSTQPNGAGTIYTPGETFTISSNTTLYPVFTENTPPPTTYTVTYNQGAATSGTPPVDTHSPYDTGVSVTVLANPGSLAESGYTFTGWSTQPNGAGTIYTPGETFTISSNTTLYPVFTENTPPPTTYTVTYNQGAATSGTPPVDTHSPYDTGVSVTVLANPGSLAESGYTFTGWSTQPNGAGTIYTPGETFTISSNTTLYPVFTENTPPPTTYTVTYNQGAATSGTPPVDTHSPYDTGVSVTVLANPGSLAESGYTFTGWSTQPNGAGTIYTPGETFTISSNTTLYPVFVKTLLIATASLSGATVGETNYSQTLQGTGGTQPYTWSITSGVLPQGLMLNASTGVISGPVGASATSETFTVTLTDHNGTTTSKQFTITVCGALSITTNSLAMATVGETNYSQTLQGIGGTQPYTWSITSGVLPQGLMLNASTGVISGPVGASATSETFTVTLTDHNGTTTSKQFTITVCGALSITTNSLAMATVGETNYSQTLQGTGGTQPYTWSITSGVLPQGLMLNASTGVISGPVGASATSETFTVTLTDHNGTTTSKQFTINVCHHR
jgi:hypothetical protein